MSTEARIEALEMEVERLQDRVALLERALGSEIVPHVCLGLTPNEAILLGVLYKRGEATKDQLFSALYAFRHEREEPVPKIIDVYICKMRKKLARFGVEIGTLWGQGYALPASSRERIAALVAERAAA